MRTLILSCNTGEGHNSCAKAIKEVYDANGEECVIADGLGFISEGVSRAIASGHVFLYRRLPRLFGWSYAYTERHPAAFNESSLAYGLFSRGTERLRSFIAGNGYDGVICTHPFAALMLTEVQKRYRLPVKTAFVATDYTCSPSVKETDLNLYFIPDGMLAADFTCTNIPEEKIVASGIPIRQMFYNQTEKADAKVRLRIPADHKHMVMMCGSMGCGPIGKLTGVISKRMEDGCELTVICGTNKRLKRRLERKYAGRGDIHIRGYVQDMSAMLDSADLYLTKPGGVSVTEAAAKKLPMVLADSVAGCEKYNRLWFVRLGAAAAEKKAEALSESCMALLSDAAKRQDMLAGFERIERNNAAAEIYRCMKGAWGDGRAYNNPGTGKSRFATRRSAGPASGTEQSDRESGDVQFLSCFTIV